MRSSNILICSLLISFTFCQYSLNISSIPFNQGDNSLLKDVLSNPEKYKKPELAEFIMKNKDILTDPEFVRLFPLVKELIEGESNDIGELYEKIGNWSVLMSFKNNDKYIEVLNQLRSLLIKGGIICGPYAKAVNSNLTTEDEKVISKEIEYLMNNISIKSENDSQQIKTIYSTLKSTANNYDAKNFTTSLDNLESLFIQLNRSLLHTEHDYSSIKNIKDFIKRMKYLCNDDKKVFQNHSYYNSEYSGSFNSGKIENSSNSNLFPPISTESHNKFYNKPDEYEDSSWDKHKRCNPNECDGCCIKNVCQPEEHCVFTSPGARIFGFIISIVLWCGCCMCFWWGLGLLILRCRRRNRYQRQINERSNEMPVTGIPVAVNQVVSGEVPNRNQIQYLNLNNSDKSIGNNDISV